jgi:serine/threonine-protein kinase
MFPLLKNGADLDDLLAHHAGLAPEVIAKWRRTRGGEIPEIPGYDILGSAGKGGTADVFRAREKKTQRVLALKVLNLESTRNPKTRAAFISEARMLEKLRHPGLVEGYGIAKSGSTYFAKMEFVEGHTLLELLDDDHRFDEKAALRVVLGVAEVLEYLATQKIVHRDIKPGNIMLASSGQMKLIDLGFAARSDEPAGDAATTAGTVQYLSPEQARGGAAADTRRDIYSLGVTLFHLVVGRLPFELRRPRGPAHAGHGVLVVAGVEESRALAPPPLLHREDDGQGSEARYQSWTELIEDVRAQIEGRESLEYEKELRSRSAKGSSKGPSARH